MGWMGSLDTGESESTARLIEIACFLHASNETPHAMTNRSPMRISHPLRPWMQQSSDLRQCDFIAFPVSDPIEFQ